MTSAIREDEKSEFAGRTYLVTGGGSGIGRAVALALGAAEARVVVAGRTPEKLEETVALIEKGGGHALAVPTDVRDPAAVDALVAAAVDRFGRLDGLVNNAAGNFVAPGIDISPNGWRAVVDIVLNGSYYCTRAVAGQLRAQGTGGSAFGDRDVRLARASGYGPLGRSQGGVLAMTRTLAVELAPLGIRLNCIAPGPTETAGAGAALWATEEARAEVLATVPAGRFADPAEIADASLFLLGERASYLTGECLTLDGGQWLGKQVYGRTAATAAH
ncbi:SDR family oxidoreductase [Streptomyces sp. ISL-98]|uniref:SDR family oxidoreductase n=1 Tax=Streptomyces sp. ISL-98 TaxID=2819192 RepID=UPI001BE51AE0|nr:SDR family oxidoreductase [Streptomyces sp. ISL-98]MBT2508003.1 SDR family oxidoreductase [Streptomyces sp. ISL-98]